jgi:hypothetical protein
MSWSTRAFTLLISSERLDFMLVRAARTIVSSEAGSQGGVRAEGPVGVVEVGRDGGEGASDRGKEWARGVGSAGEATSGVGAFGSGGGGPSSSVDIGVSVSVPEVWLSRLRMRDFRTILPLDLVREAIGDGLGAFDERIADVKV